MKKTIIITSIAIIVILILLILTNNIEKISDGIVDNNKLLESDSFTISSPEKNKILVTISRENGIDKIEYPNGFVVNGRGKNKIGINFEVESEKEYTFKTIDSNGNETYDTFITPIVHIELTKNDVDVNLEDQRQNIVNQLLTRNIATNFMEFGTGSQSSINTQTQNVQTIFNTWKSFGDGNWGYNTSNKWIYNTKNSEQVTGYYDPNGNYDSIELSFQARTTDSDDDLMGSMVRFTENGTGVYTSYFFSLDRHDTTGKGLWNGAINGITKLNNSTFTQANLSKLSVNPSLRWTRSTWQSYKFTAKGSKIEAYLDGKLVASAVDSSITSGSYGFMSYSQAYSYYRNITVTTITANTLEQVVASKTWDAEGINVVINYNNSTETILLDESCKQLFIDNNIHYIGVGNDDNKAEVDEFVAAIGNKGTFTQSSDIENATTDIGAYIEQIF